MDDIILIGAGGHGRDVLDAARAQGRSVIGFLDDDRKTHGTMLNGIPVLGGLEWLATHKTVQIVLAVGNPVTKRKLATLVAHHHPAIAPPIIHPHAWVSGDAQVGEGTVILAGCSIQPQVRIGRHVYISTVNTLGHDTVAEDYVSTSPGVQVGGESTLEVGCFIGIGATVLPRVRVGAWTVVGAGSVVVKELPARCTAVGVPARVIKIHEGE